MLRERERDVGGLYLTEFNAQLRILLSSNYTTLNRNTFDPKYQNSFGGIENN